MRKRAKKALEEQKRQEKQRQFELAIQKMHEYVKEAGKPCSVAQFQTVDQDTHCKTSRFLGNQVVLLPQENFPENNGQIMTPILQVNLTDVPYLPEILRGKAWLSVFMDLEAMLLGSHPNGENWILKTYDSLDELEVREIPLNQIQEKAKKWQAAQISWTKETDVLDNCSTEYDVLPEKWRNISDETPFHCYRSKPRQWFDKTTQEYFEASNRFAGDNMYSWHIAATKLGGYPTYHQYDEEKGVPSHPGSFTLQIMNGIKHQVVDQPKDQKRFDLCDCSTTYLGWIDGEWWMETQTS
ncbi:hypothetical protein BKI52_40510 [marine bacterium AO1-C]|nr:hypothetical protein BKI52_40510 [marine bacterium AO1-C]